MMWDEFEKIAGYEVSYETYHNVIEPMYMASPLSKQDFVKSLNKKAFALPSKQAMVKRMKKMANDMWEACGLTSQYKEEDELQELAYQYAKRFYNVDRNDLHAWVFFTRRYAYCGVPQVRGCSTPVELVIGYEDAKGRTYDYERIELVKNAGKVGPGCW